MLAVDTDIATTMPITSTSSTAIPEENAVCLLFLFAAVYFPVARRVLLLLTLGQWELFITFFSFNLKRCRLHAHPILTDTESNETQTVTSNFWIKV
jgi:hypothetical protein